MRLVGYYRSWDFEGAHCIDSSSENFDKYFEDKAIAVNSPRPALQELLGYLNEGDSLVVQSIDRIANSVADLHMIVQAVTTRNCTIEFREENISFTGKDDTESAIFRRVIRAIAKVELLSQLASKHQPSQSENSVHSAPASTDKSSGKLNEDSKLNEIRRKRAAGASIQDLQEEYNLSRGAIYRMTSA